MVDKTEFYAFLQKRLATLNHTLANRGVQLDGKTLRRSFYTASGKALLHLVNASSSDHPACLEQVAVEKDSNEKTAVLELLEMLELTGAIVTLDAMHSKVDAAGAIRNMGTDYVLPQKPRMDHR